MTKFGLLLLSLLSAMSPNPSHMLITRETLFFLKEKEKLKIKAKTY